MGMFDYIQCKKNLPLNEELQSLSVDWKSIQFQTKDLDNCLSNYTITEEGKLVENVVEYEHEYFTEEERKKKGHKPWNIIKNSTEKFRGQKEIQFHGKILFYDILEFTHDLDIWVDFEAYFIYGKLDDIKLTKVEKHESSKVRLEEWNKETEKKQKSLLYRIKKRTGWFWFWKTISRICYNIGRQFDQLNMVIVKYMLK